ncbi:MAG: hypothetical protein ABWZ66_06315 [Pyrinomonadaceae bacterium]
MTKARINFLTALALLVFVSLACGRFGKNINSTTTIPTPDTNAKSTPKTTIKNDDDSTSGEEKQKPASGKGNVQGKVLFNEQAVEGIEVKICENFSTILGIRCTGKTATVKTDKDGVFVLANLEPKTYGGLTAKVFKSNYYIYPQEGIMTPQSFDVEADKTIFSPDIHLFKDDVKITNPKSGAKTDAKNLELKWDAYPDASYYKVSLYPDAGGSSPVSGDRVDDPTYTVMDELTNGKYRIKVEAYNTNDRKLAESSDDIKFTVTGGTEAAPK